MLSCEEVARQLSDSLDGELPWTTRLQMRLHVLLCRPCRAMERSMKRTVAALRALGSEPTVQLGEERAGVDD